MGHSGAQCSNQDGTDIWSDFLTGEIDNTGSKERKCRYHILSNRTQFYLHHALIIVIKKDNGDKCLYRLVVYHNKKFLTDLLYESLRGAKIAFKKYHGQRPYSKLETQWSEIPGDLNEFHPPLPNLPPLPPLAPLPGVNVKNALIKG